MQDVPDLIQTLNRSGRRLSKSHQMIARFISQHYDRAAGMTAAHLSECVHVSESTVIRFASAMGYDSYTQLQQALLELASHHLTGYQRMELSRDMEGDQVLETVLRSDMNNIQATLNRIDRKVYQDVVSRILHAHSIYVMGLRSAAPLAQFMGFYLNYIFDRVHLVSSLSADVYEEIAKLRAEDVLIGISFPRYSNRTMDAMVFAKRCGAQVIAITDGPLSPLCTVADATLTARTDMASFVDSLAAPLSLINALLVSLGLERKEAVSAHLRQLESVWDTYHVYVGDEHHG